MSDSAVRWALGWCPSGLVVTACLALLLLPPAQYYAPELAPPLAAPEEAAGPTWLDRALEFPPLDLFVTVMFLLLAFVTYLCGWIQRKVMEKRIVKLNQYLSSSLDRLRSWDAQQERLETELRLVQDATAEYNLLLYLLLRRARCAPHGACAPHGPHAPCAPSDCFFDKAFDEVPLLPSAADS